MKFTLTLLAASTFFAAAQDCQQAYDSTLSKIEKVKGNKTAVLAIVSAESGSNESCADEIAKAAIVGSEADVDLVADIVEASITAAPDEADSIIDGAKALAPDAADEIEEVADNTGSNFGQQVAGENLNPLEDAAETTEEGEDLVPTPEEREITTPVDADATPSEA